MSDGYWFCPQCMCEVDSSCVTFEECHDLCGSKLGWIKESTDVLVPRALIIEAEKIARTLHQNSNRTTREWSRDVGDRLRQILKQKT